MNVDLRPSTRRVIEESAAAAEARAFIERLDAEHLGGREMRLVIVAEARLASLPKSLVDRRSVVDMIA